MPRKRTEPTITTGIRIPKRLHALVIKNDINLSSKVERWLEAFFKGDMAMLITCRGKECGATYATTLKKCPHCGFKTKVSLRIAEKGRQRGGLLNKRGNP